MITKIKFNSMQDVEDLHKYATFIEEDSGLHSLDSSKIADIKSYLGVINLELNEPLLLVSENEEIHNFAKKLNIIV